MNEYNYRKRRLSVAVILLSSLIFFSATAIAQTPPGNTLSFDGANDYVSIAGSGLDLTGDRTVEAWVYVEDFTKEGGPTSRQRRIFYNRISNGNAYQLALNSDDTNSITGFAFAGHQVSIFAR